MTAEQVRVLIGLAGASVVMAVLVIALLLLIACVHERKSRAQEVTPCNDTQPHQHRYVTVDVGN